MAGQAEHVGVRRRLVMARSACDVGCGPLRGLIAAAGIDEHYLPRSRGSFQNFSNLIQRQPCFLEDRQAAVGQRKRYCCPSPDRHTPDRGSMLGTGRMAPRELSPCCAAPATARTAMAATSVLTAVLIRALQDHNDSLLPLWTGFAACLVGSGKCFNYKGD
jgi:hypothetical protein